MGIGPPSPHSGPPHRFPAAASRAGVVVVLLLGCCSLFQRGASLARARVVQTPDPGRVTLYHIPPQRASPLGLRAAPSEDRRSEGDNGAASLPPSFPPHRRRQLNKTVPVLV